MYMAKKAGNTEVTSSGLVIGTPDDGVNLLGSTLGLSGVRNKKSQHQVTQEGLPGIEHNADVSTPPKPNSIAISYTDYSASKIATGNVSDLDEFLAMPMRDWVNVRWINISPPHAYVINQFRQHFEFHTLTAEDVLHIPQRPRVEFFDDHLFVVLRMIQLLQSEPRDGIADSKATSRTLDTEQVSFFLYNNVLITFQEKLGDVWQPIRDRLQKDNVRIRKNAPDYLLYALIDAIVDHCFPVLEQYGDVLEDLEQITLDKPSTEVLHRIYSIKRQLALLRRIVWPMREVVDHLYRDEDGRISDATKPYLRDVYEHTVQIVEIIESYREMASGLTELYMSAVSNRMNEIMKVLTIMASVFIPLTFIAGVYGMNFQYMPELTWRWAYPAIWCVFILLTIAMMFYFWRRGWIGKG